MQWGLAAWLGIACVTGVACGQGKSRQARAPTLLKTITSPLQENTVGQDSKGAIQFDNTEADVTKHIRKTEHGPVKGVQWKDDENVLAFVDVPYGAFEKPFSAPTDPKKWTEAREYTEHRSLCPQLEPPFDPPVAKGTADCLTVSVFTPLNATKAPVLFHVYDGDFVSDSAHPGIYGPEYLVPKGVILVLPNYRLGPLGFLCLQNDTAPGNAALKDLTLALKWTVNNIEEFGGNSSNIVVSGEGTAGALAQYLALSPMSRDYVKGVIAESGTVLAPWAIDRDPLATATKLVNAMNKQITNDNDAIDIMIKKSNGINFRPCVEHGSEVFMNETPWQMLKKKNINDIVFIIGSANHAGMQEAADQNLLDMNYDFTKFLPNDLKFVNEDERKEIGGNIRGVYFNGTISLNNEADLSLYHTDALYLGPAIRTARLLADAGAKVYFYEFSYVGELNRVKNSLQERIKVEGGAARGDIVGYLFVEQNPESDSSDDFEMIQFMTQMWTSFARDGIPTPDSNMKWERLEKTDEELEVWLSIGAEPKMNSSGVHVDRLHIWTDLYDNHFVETNLAVPFSPSLFLILLASITVYTHF